MEQLAVRNLAKAFEATQALKDVSFSVGRGEVLALCGENGAGKSTLIRILSGAIRPDRGTIAIAGSPTAIRDPHHAHDLGIRTVHQELSLLPHISVAENILLGRMPHGRFRFLIDWRAAYAEAERVLADFGFADIDVRQRVAELSVSRQQIVEIAKALVSQPSILILDEPTSVLSALESDRLFEKIRQLKAAGTTVIYISHRMAEVFDVCDRIVVLKDGVSVYEAATAEASEEAVVRAMVGRPLAAIYPPARPPAGAPVLEVRGLSLPGRFEDIAFTVRAGEIVGMFGLVGSGRTEVAKAIFGAAPAEAGEILIDGRPVAIGSPAEAVRHGIALVTEDRKRDGLALELSVLDNGGLASMGRVARHGVLDRRRQARLVEAEVDQLSIRPRGVARPVRQLSGGNQQKVVLAKWLLVEGIRVFICDEPTRGVDIATKVEIYRIIAGLAARGMAVLMISSEMPEVLGMSDRLLIMRGGRIVAELGKEAFDMEVVFGHAAAVARQKSA